MSDSLQTRKPTAHQRQKQQQKGPAGAVLRRTDQRRQPKQSHHATVEIDHPAHRHAVTTSSFSGMEGARLRPHLRGLLGRALVVVSLN